MTTAVNVNFPMLVKYFQTSLSNVQWFSTGAMIVSAITMISSAYVDNRFKDQTVFLIATLALLTSLLICTFANNFGLFLVGRLFNGISIGSCTPLMFNVIPKLVPRTKIGFYMALGATVVAVGPSLGPTYGGLINTFLNWRMIFIIIIPVTLVLMVLGLLTITNHLPINHQIKFDGVGLSLIILTFSTIAIGFNSLNHLSIAVLIVFLIGIDSLILFLKHGTNPHAILNTKVLRYPRFAWAVLAYFIIQMTNISLSGLLIPNFSQVALGVTSLISGLILLPGNLFRIVSMPIGGAMLDKFGARRPINIGLLLMATYFLVMFFTVKNLNVSEILFTYIIYNLGLAFSFSNVLTSGLESLPVSMKGDGNAIFNAVQIYGGAIGTCLLSLILSLANKLNPELTNRSVMYQGSQWCFIFLFVIVLLTLISVHFSLKLVKINKVR